MLWHLYWYIVIGSQCPWEYFVHLLVGLIHVVYNYEKNWTMRNLHTLLGAQQGFRHELATKYALISH